MHFAMHFRDSDVNVVGCSLEAAGAAFGNVAFSSDVSSALAAAQPVLRDCDLVSEGADALGVQILHTDLAMEGCRIKAEITGVFALSGTTTIRDSRIETSGLNPVYNAVSSATILSGQVHFIGGNPEGSTFKYAFCMKANFDPVVNGIGSTVE